MHFGRRYWPAANTLFGAPLLLSQYAARKH